MSPVVTVDEVNAAVNISEDGTVTFDNDSVLITGDGFKLGLGDLLESTYNGTYYSAGYTSALTFRNDNLKLFFLTNLSNAASLGTNVLVTDGDTTNFKFKDAALKKESVSISGGENAFTVELDDDVDTTAEPINFSKTLTDGTLYYTAAGTGEHYTATDTGVTYTAQGAGEEFTLSGISNADGVTVNDYNITVNQTALDMTATAAYTVKLEGDSKFAMTFGGNMDSTDITLPPTRPPTSRAAARSTPSRPPKLRARSQSAA